MKDDYRENPPADCALIHVPLSNCYYKPGGHFSYINIMPIGLFSIADVVTKNGLSCQILHHGIEQLKDRGWQVGEYVKESKAVVAGLSLHWHLQSHDVIEVCRRIKKKAPDVYIVLGGFTATYFDVEILKDFDFIDGIICGDGEVPFMKLVKQIKMGDADLHQVPNLTWKNDEKKIVKNKISFRHDEHTLNHVEFTTFNLLKNYSMYIDYGARLFQIIPGRTKAHHQKVNDRIAGTKRRIFSLCVGLGCKKTCTWCSASYISRKKYRQKIIWRNIDDVLRDIKKSIHYGFSAIEITFDPTPDDLKYYHRLFRAIQKNNLKNKIGCRFVATGLVDDEFADLFAETFHRDYRIIAVSPENGNEKIRKRNKGFYYSNNELFQRLDYLKKREIDFEIYFSIGIPGENEIKLKDTIALQRELRKRYGKNTIIDTWPIEMEPGAPWSMKNTAFGIKSSRKTFSDYLNAVKKGKVLRSGLGYYDPAYFKKPLNTKTPENDFSKRINQLLCRQFCDKKMICKISRFTHLVAKYVSTQG